MVKHGFLKNDGMKIEVNPIKINRNVFDKYSYIEKRMIIDIGGYAFFRAIIS